MSTLAESLIEIKKPWQWIAVGGAILLVWGAIAFPRHHNLSEPASHATLTSAVPRFYAESLTKAKPVAVAQGRDAVKTVAVAEQSPADVAQRMIIRTSSMEMVVRSPSETAGKIAALAEGMGGYLVSADGGGQNATAGILTIRVPAPRLEEARAEIRKLGLRVESEKVDAQDVTRQYVDQGANIRNLRAEEAQYLAILKQATSVKDMLAVTARLSEVRGQIEEQQAEFNALSRQVETVAIAVSLRTETEATVFSLDWHPVDQLKAALRNGLESLATYVTAVAAMLFYLPAVLLWVGTILAGVAGSWKAVRWAGQRWFGWTDSPPHGREF
jgi:Domain of unknown function (DUF4349)